MTITPVQYKNAIMILIHKKGDKPELENYHPISLLSHSYKLFMKIIPKRIETKLNFYQPRDQAGVRRGYGTNNHLQVIKYLIEENIE